MNCPKCQSAKLCGHEILGVWDGVAYWSCMDCGHRWHRFPKNDRRRIRLKAIATEPIAEMPKGADE